MDLQPVDVVEIAKKQLNKMIELSKYITISEKVNGSWDFVKVWIDSLRDIIDQHGWSKYSLMSKSDMIIANELWKKYHHTKVIQVEGARKANWIRLDASHLDKYAPLTTIAGITIGSIDPIFLSRESVLKADIIIYTCKGTGNYIYLKDRLGSRIRTIYSPGGEVIKKY